jgi:hypothetical protein
VRRSDCGAVMQNPSNKQCERFSFLIYRHLTPTTMQSCDAIVGFNWFSAFAAFARTVSFGPVVNKCLKNKPNHNWSSIHCNLHLEIIFYFYYFYFLLNSVT